MQKHLFTLLYQPGTVTIKTDALQFCIPAITPEDALEKSLKYGAGAVVIKQEPLNKFW